MEARQREFEDGVLIAGTRFRVIGLLGSGGMGSVYQVEHTELGKRFVLKALHKEFAGRGELAARLRQEWRALGKLEHPNIVTVTDAGTAANVPYYVMERLEGETLAARMRRRPRLTVPEAIEIAVSILDGLAAAHSVGIVHRDIKPPNVFLARGNVAGSPASRNQKFTVKLLDFGVAKVANPDADLTSHGVAIGTPRYMSPEQARGERVDGRADLYAVGLILFEMVAGTGPFHRRRDAHDVLLAHLTEPAPRLSSRVPGIPLDLDDMVSSLLAKDCRERPTSARAVAAALREMASRYDTGGLITDAETVVASHDAPTALGTAAGREKPVPRSQTGASQQSTAALLPTVAQTSPSSGETRIDPHTQLDPAFSTTLPQLSEPGSGSTEHLEPEASAPTAGTTRTALTSCEQALSPTPAPVERMTKARRKRAPRSASVRSSAVLLGLAVAALAVWLLLRDGAAPHPALANTESMHKGNPSAAITAPALTAPPPSSTADSPPKPPQPEERFDLAPKKAPPAPASAAPSASPKKRVTRAKATPTDLLPSSGL